MACGRQRRGRKEAPCHIITHVCRCAHSPSMACGCKGTVYNLRGFTQQDSSREHVLTTAPHTPHMVTIIHNVHSRQTSAMRNRVSERSACAQHETRAPPFCLFQNPALSGSGRLASRSLEVKLIHTHTTHMPTVATWLRRQQQTTPLSILPFFTFSPGSPTPMC